MLAAVPTDTLSVDEAMKRLDALAPVMHSLFSHGESWIESLPLPAWVTAPTGEMIMFNESYQYFYEKSRIHYFGGQTMLPGQKILPGASMPTTPR